MKRVMYKVLSVIAFVLAAFLLLTGWIFNNDSSVKDTVKNNQVLNSTFREASSFVDDFFRGNGRLPTDVEFTEWTNKFGPYVNTPREMRLNVSGFPADALSQLGSPPESSHDNYLLVQSDGNEDKYWASWNQKSTASEDPAHFYIFGRKIADQIFYYGGGALTIFVALLLWRLSNKRKVDIDRGPATIK